MHKSVLGKINKLQKKSNNIGGMYGKCVFRAVLAQGHAEQLPGGPRV
jgi:hypothetical protein